VNKNKGEAENMAIHVNQTGYYTNERKTAVFTAGETFMLCRAASDETVLTGSLVEKGLDEASEDHVKTADFTEASVEGTFYLKSDTGETSYSFDISSNLYKNLKNDALKAFYYQRCGCALDEKHAGIFKHDCCHDSLVHIYGEDGVTKDATGGWHDAGDYGRYTTAAATALAHMLYAYRLFPLQWEESINIPESGNGMADLLNECRYELDWLFKMQREDGGVYHKLTSFRHANFVMPEEDKKEFYLFPVSTMAVADFAAVMALTYRIFEKIDEDYAKKALQAAVKSWKWLGQHPEFIYVGNPEGCNTGGYDDDCDQDERFWAAAELWMATGEKEYQMAVERGLKDIKEITNFGWTDVAGLAGLAILTDEKQYATESVKTRFLDAFSQESDRLVELSKSCGYEVAMGADDYVWGSNMVVENRAMLLAVTYILTGDTRYHQTVIAQMDYLLGKNAVGYSYVTGYGTKAFSHPHNRPTIAAKVENVMPGWVSGGPNSKPCDEKAEWLIVEGTPPMKCYIDEWECYSLNEITIYWNSPMVFLAAYLQQQNQ
jgi:endoglucanase